MNTLRPDDPHGYRRDLGGQLKSGVVGGWGGYHIFWGISNSWQLAQPHTARNARQQRQNKMDSFHLELEYELVNEFDAVYVLRMKPTASVWLAN